MRFARRGPTRRAEPLAGIALVATALVLSACGSSQGTDSTRADRQGPVSAVEPKKDRAAPKSASAGHRAAPEEDAASQRRRRPHRAQPSGQRAAAGQERSKQAKEHEAPAGVDEAAGTCPRSLTRAQCIANARASAPKTPSHTVEKPRDCLEAMSRSGCEALIEQEQAAQESAGSSFAPDECLRHLSRQECEAIFEAMGQSPR